VQDRGTGGLMIQILFPSVLEQGSRERLVAMYAGAADAAWRPCMLACACKFPSVLEQGAGEPGEARCHVC
jgi:hypothetical protein